VKTRKDYFLDCLNVLLLKEFGPGQFSSQELMAIQNQAWLLPEDAIPVYPADAAYAFFRYWHDAGTVLERSMPEWMIVAEELKRG
jgi:hypothetical protein